MTIPQQDNIILDGALLSHLRTDIQDIFYVDHVETPRRAPQGTILFVGNLLMQDSEAAYEIIAERWRARDYTPMLRHHQGQIGLIAHPGIFEAKPGNPWINLAFGIVTVGAVWITGATSECFGQNPSFLLTECLPWSFNDWLLGLPMMLAMMAILLAHEFGHYFAARYHKVAVTLPYFIPLPLISPVGTLGAFIQLRSPFKTKKQLFDIGIAGPLGGLIIALPLIFWVVANSPIREIRDPSRPPGSLEGNSLFYLGVKYLIYGELLPSFDQYSGLPFLQEFVLLLAGAIPQGGGNDIFINSLGIAVWFGLFITALNLIPVGQLDGGHIIYCLIGDKARYLGMALIVLMFLAGIFWWPGWLFWVFLTFFIIGPYHPPPLNDLVPIGTGRKMLAYIMIFVFIIMFMPNPLQPL